jgi:DNA-binding transcriptional regulator YiaG
VFAAILGIGKTTVQQWEQRQKKPAVLRNAFLKAKLSRYF